MIYLRDGLDEFMRYLEFTDEERSEVLRIYDEIRKNEDAYAVFFDFARRYCEEREECIQELLTLGIQKITALTGLHHHEVSLAVCLATAPYSKRYYEEAGLDEKIWRASMLDFKYKLRECEAISGMIGLRGDTWFENWYYAKRVALHRLQFELRPARAPHKSERFNVELGDTLVTLHIPSMREIPFDKQNRELSYRLAEEYFAPRLDGAPLVFTCHSWLLAPFHRDILPRGSNIRDFLNEFELGEFVEHRDELWRIFNRETSDLPPDDELPEETSLQRAYKRFLLSGGRVGSAQGYLIR